ncbi:MAG: putative DNA base hypermodification protein [Rhizonema sp. NSF051]|nr:putative DNA base hypermodification protein [Rhizonema sp. NSF051]
MKKLVFGLVHIVEKKIVELLGGLHEDLPSKIQDARNMHQGFDLLRNYPTIGNFLAYQFITDINYRSRDSSEAIASTSIIFFQKLVNPLFFFLND